MLYPYPWFRLRFASLVALALYASLWGTMGETAVVARKHSAGRLTDPVRAYVRFSMSTECLLGERTQLEMSNLAFTLDPREEPIHSSPPALG